MLKAYNPFSVGSRQCIGKGLAIWKPMTVLATVLGRFEFRGFCKLGEGKVGGVLGRDRVGEF
jgi:hypothetical protein